MEDGVEDDAPQPPAGELDWEPVMGWYRAHGPDVAAGHWEPPVRMDDGSITMPYAVPSQDALDLVRVLYDTRVVAPFAWPDWMTARGQHLVASGLVDADLEDCRRLLTALVRGDRFNEGQLVTSLENGTVHRILDRVASLLSGE